MDFTTITRLSGDDLYKLALTFKLANNTESYYIFLIMSCNYGCQLAKDEFHDSYYDNMFVGNIIGSQDYSSRLQFLESTKEYAFSAFVLGEMYDRGTGVTQDYKIAKTLYESSIKKDNTCVYSMNNLALLYKMGQGTDVDLKMSTKLSKAAIRYRSPHAIYKAACRDFDAKQFKACVKGLETAVMLGYEKAVDKLVEVYKSPIYKNRMQSYVIPYFIKLDKPEKLKEIYGYDDNALYVMKQNAQLKKEFADLELGLMMKSLMSVPVNTV